MRASDAEREHAVDALRAPAGDGRLTLEELSERLERALTATTRDELEPLTADLPAPAVESPERQRRGRRGIMAIIGGSHHKGRWRIAPRCTVVNLMGGAHLDLRQALVEGAETRITVLALMGGSHITVPHGVEVELNGFALMGGNHLSAGGPPPGPGAPAVLVRAFSIMGGTHVKTAPPGR